MLTGACASDPEPDDGEDGEPSAERDGGSARTPEAGARMDSSTATPRDSSPVARDAASDATSTAPDSSLPSEPDASVPTTSGDLWIAPDGDDNNVGTQASPKKSLEAAVAAIQPGATIWVSAGTYELSQTVKLTRDGTEQRPIQIFAAPGKRPLFDFSGQTPGESTARGIQVSGTYFHLRGLEIIKAGDNCVHISGSHNQFEDLIIHECGDTGLQITANGSEAGDDARAAHNLVLNTDSYANYDPANQGENADGFAAKLYIGPGNVFRGCRAWNNADDGWDLFASDDVVVIEDSWAIANGKIGPSQNNTNGDGNGFKLGGAAKAGDANMGGAIHKVSNCISIENAACGFTRNNNTMSPALSMCGGRGDSKGLLCSLTNQGTQTVTMGAAQAIAVKRGADGALP